jgi:hypothetical protein
MAGECPRAAGRRNMNHPIASHSLLAACLWLPLGTAMAVAPVTIGPSGVSPVVAAAPDGTLFAAAEQNLYRSTNAGVTWAHLAGPGILSSLVATDSAITVDPAGRVYLTFNYISGASTALCTSDDAGSTWRCDAALVTGGTAQPWVAARSAAAYLEATPSAGEAAFLASDTGGASWLATPFSGTPLSGAAGPLMASPASSHVLQANKWRDPSDDVNHVAVQVLAPGAGPLGTTIFAATRTTPLLHPNGLPSGAFDTAGTLYLVSEAMNGAMGQQLVVASSADEGASWVTLPALPGGNAGTATLGWLTAGAPGHVGVLYYFSPQSGSAASLPPSATWSVMWAESSDADTATPHWAVSTLENIGHLGPICGSCQGEAHFAGNFLNAKFDDAGRAHLVWVAEDSQHGTTLRYAPSKAADTIAPSGGGGGALDPALLAVLGSLVLARRRRFAPE